MSPEFLQSQSLIDLPSLSFSFSACCGLAFDPLPLELANFEQPILARQTSFS